MRSLRLILLAVVVLLVVLVVRALLFTPRAVAVAEAAPYAADTAAIAERLAGALRVQTVSDPALRKAEEFTRFREYLAQTYADVWSALEVELVGESLLLTWKGSDPALQPLMLLAHQDVVPVEPGTEALWEHPPFGGEQAGGFVWGRGALDDKASLITQLEAVRALVAQGFKPQRTVLLGFGHDEEVRGDGARAIVARLQERKLRPALVTDEGQSVVRGVVPGIAKPVVLLGIAEKGFLTVELTAKTEGGHASMPPTHSAIGRLSAYLAQLEDEPFPARLEGVAAASFDAMGREMPFGNRLALANRWLLGPLILRQLLAKPTTAATVHTTVAATVFQAGVRDNVLARNARALVNLRILPGDTRALVLERLRSLAAAHEVTVEELPGSMGSEPSPVTRLDGRGFALMEKVARAVYPGTVVTPSLVLGATDSRSFAEAADAVVRFAPLELGPEDISRIHGANERIAVEVLGRMVRFSRELITQADAPGAL
jgi:carboxypeptidase PM20D1